MLSPTLQKILKAHTCRFNDGDLECECYKSALILMAGKLLSPKEFHDQTNKTNGNCSKCGAALKNIGSIQDQAYWIKMLVCTEECWKYSKDDKKQ